MKEYKVMMTKCGLVRRDQKLEELLNRYAREGWQVSHIAAGWASVVLERDKIR